MPVLLFGYCPWLIEGNGNIRWNWLDGHLTSDALVFPPASYIEIYWHQENSVEINFHIEFPCRWLASRITQVDFKDEK